MSSGFSWYSARCWREEGREVWGERWRRGGHGRGAVWRNEFCSHLKPVDRLTPLSHTLVRTLNPEAIFAVTKIRSVFFSIFLCALCRQTALMCLYLLSVLGSSHVFVNECFTWWCFRWIPSLFWGKNNKGTFINVNNSSFIYSTLACCGLNLNYSCDWGRKHARSGWNSL